MQWEDLPVVIDAWVEKIAAPAWDVRQRAMNVPASPMAAILPGPLRGRQHSAGVRDGPADRISKAGQYPAHARPGEYGHGRRALRWIRYLGLAGSLIMASDLCAVTGCGAARWYSPRAGPSEFAIAHQARGGADSPSSSRWFPGAPEQG